ncbi:DUF4256 domain-containing protein [bacterium]|nr:DUF4256 domain-containing protein [bacterium]
MASRKSGQLLSDQSQKLLAVLKKRFDANPKRHKGVDWKRVEAALLAQPAALLVLHKMEQTGGEPDVVAFGKKAREIVFVDCAKESPKGRRSICYDRESLESRKEHKPKSDAGTMASEIGIDILTEHEYRDLQDFGEFDLTTSSWIQTPSAIRDLGGALFCDRRYGHVFVYHNGASSYYAARGFRGILRIAG